VTWPKEASVFIAGVWRLLTQREWQGFARKNRSTFVRKSFNNAADYVTRRFNASLAGLKKLVGLILR
jgi:hypothetical protein